MRIFIIAMAFTFAVGCSFKKDNGDKSKGGNEREVLANTLSSDFDKLALAIATNDSILFNSTVKQAKRAELNKLSPGGKSLLEMALEADRYEFFKGLLEYGASPFRSTVYAFQGMRNTTVKKREYREAIINATRKMLADSTLVCLKDNLEATEAFIDENFIPPLQPVCGDEDLFSYHLQKTTADLNLKDHFVRKYVRDEENGRMSHAVVLLKIGIAKSDLQLLGLLGRSCSQWRCTFEVRFLKTWIEKRPLKDVIAIYATVKEAYGDGGISVQEPEPILLPPPPPPPGASQDQWPWPSGEESFEEHPQEQVPTEIVAYVKYLVTGRLAATPETEKQPLAQQLQELGLN